MVMDIRSRPELEELLRHDSEFGYRSIEHAVSLLHAHASWFAEDRAEVNAEGADSAAANLINED
jgi:hypothetical protein